MLAVYPLVPDREEPYTLPEIVQRIVEWFFVQRHDQSRENGDCCYRTECGNACAIGCLIPDSVYNEDMEYMDYISVWKGNSAIRNLFPEKYQYLLNTLQGCHDNSDRVTFHNEFLHHLRTFGQYDIPQEQYEGFRSMLEMELVRTKQIACEGGALLTQSND